MGYKQTNKFCRQCGTGVLAAGRTPSHVLHLVLTVLSVGLWLPIWILLALFSTGGYRCSNCGSKV